MKLTEARAIAFEFYALLPHFTVIFVRDSIISTHRMVRTYVLFLVVRPETTDWNRDHFISIAAKKNFNYQAYDSLRHQRIAYVKLHAYDKNRVAE